MKKLLTLPLVVICAMTLLIGCLAKDGLQGPPGKDGTDGSSGTTSCMQCHTDSNFNIKTVQYHYSKHFYGTTVARGQGSRFCARCHTNEGFQEITWNGMPIAAAEIPNATKIQCATCHKMSNFSFPGDTINSILRTTDPVTLMYLNQNTLAGWTTTVKVDNTITGGSDSGSKINNLCITCHQIRYATAYEYTQDTSTVAGTVKYATKSYAQNAYFPMGTAILPGDTATVAKGNLKKPTDSVAYMTGRTFAVHDGNQSNMFYGRYAYDFGTPIDPDATRHHAKDECTSCHMNAWDTTAHTGGHSLIVNMNDPACAACHHLADTMVTTQAANEVLRVQLAEALVARKVMKKATSTAGVVTYTILATNDFFGKLYSNKAADSAVTYASTTAWNTTDTTTGTIKYRNLITYAKDADLKNRIGRRWTYGELGAAYNYGFYTSELSKGAHNDQYAKRLLQASINWLAAHP